MKTDVKDRKILAIMGILGCLGGVLLLMGFYCLYKTIADNLSKIEKGWLLFIGSGIAMTPVGHFVIACICPMTYKAALNLGLSDELSRTLAGTGIEGVTESFESLGEGAVYLTVLSHLKRNK